MRERSGDLFSLNTHLVTFWNYLTLCALMSTHMYNECSCVCACVWRSDINLERSQLFSTFIWVRVSHWTWSSLIWLGWLSNKLQGSNCLHLSSAGIIDTGHEGTREPNSGPHACMSKTLLTNPSPDLLTIWLLKFFGLNVKYPSEAHVWEHVGP